MTLCINGMNAALCAMAVIVITSCTSESPPDQNVLVTELKAFNESTDAITLTDVKKLDGQLSADGLNYKMDFSAVYTVVGGCVEVPDLPAVTNMLEHEPSATSCGAGPLEFRRIYSAYELGRGFSAHLNTAVAEFTKKESGWSIVATYVKAGDITDNPTKEYLAEVQHKKIRDDFREIQTALQKYRLDNYTYPSTEQGLEALLKPSQMNPKPRNFRGRYLSELLLDPWGNPYQYKNPGENSAVDIYTLGADGMAGGEGENADIGNWKSS
jgi:general secretion pathway protein G